jgi:hypothetical protein
MQDMISVHMITWNQPGTALRSSGFIDVETPTNTMVSFARILESEHIRNGCYRDWTITAVGWSTRYQPYELLNVEDLV